jgi:hypothetical protein
MKLRDYRTGSPCDRQSEHKVQELLPNLMGLISGGTDRSIHQQKPERFRRP